MGEIDEERKYDRSTIAREATGEKDDGHVVLLVHVRAIGDQVILRADER